VGMPFAVAQASVIADRLVAAGDAAVLSAGRLDAMSSRVTRGVAD